MFFGVYMWNLFRKNSLISDDDFLFQIETFEWLLDCFGGDDFFDETTLVYPTKKFFPETVYSDREAAEVTFKYVKQYAGMKEWECELLEQEKDYEHKVAPTLVVENLEQGPLGTFSRDNDQKIIITYNPAIVSDSTQLVATLSHELAHYLTSTADSPPPGGWENWEFATDIAAVFLGFGIFLANSAFVFDQYTDIDSQGWKTSRSGYLSESEYAYSLSIFMKLKDISPKDVYPFLKPNIKSLVKHSWSELGGNKTNERSARLENLLSRKPKTTTTI